MSNQHVQSYAASRSQDAKPLRELLPLDTPLSLMVDPTNACNFRCVFCPTGDADLLQTVGRKKTTLSLELFQKLVRDLAEFPRPVRVLHLYKDGEPLANKHLPEMIAAARQSGCVTRIETTTNGSLLTEERATAIVQAGIDGIRISIYAVDDAGYLSIAQSTVGFQRVRDNVAALFAIKTRLRPETHIHCKIVDAGLSDAVKQRFLSEFSEISDSVHIDSIMGWSNTGARDLTLGLNPQRGITDARIKPERSVCSEPFMKLAVNSNGEVSVCCVDWAHETVVGDLCSESLFAIWNGPRLQALRLLHLTGRRREHPACGKCQYIHGLPEMADLDADRERLSAVYQERRDQLT